MTDHKTGTREEWLSARFSLLKGEKKLKRRSDELARRDRDQRIHRNPFILVTLTRRSSRLKNSLGSSTAGNSKSRSGGLK
jgi:hypothetical protein